MTESAKAERSCGGFDMGATQRKWWQFSRIFNPDVGLLPVLEPGDPRWMEDWFKRSLAASSWLGYIPAPLLRPYVSESMHQPSHKISKWRVSMDVAHFHPSEISLRVKDGFLEVSGRHEERPDEHGFITRCFTRKYRLPAEVDSTKLTSRVSVEGFLTVEAPVPEFSVPVSIVIPIKVESGGTGEQGVKTENKGEESQSEVQGDPDQPCSSTPGLELEDEETQEKPAGDTQPSVSAGDKSFESLQQSPEHHNTLEESPGASNQLEPFMDGMQVKVEGGEELTQPEEQELGLRSDVQSQELEAADVKSEHTD